MPPDAQQPEARHHGGVHPFAQVARIVPAPGDVDMLAGIAPPRVVQ
jgi:hypothetical protein